MMLHQRNWILIKGGWRFYLGNFLISLKKEGMEAAISDEKFQKLVKKHIGDRRVANTNVFYVIQFGKVFGCHLCESQFGSYKAVYSHFVSNHIEVRPVCYNRYFDNPKKWSWREHHVAMTECQTGDEIGVRPKSRPSDVKAYTQGSGKVVSSGNPALGMRAAPTKQAKSAGRSKSRQRAEPTASGREERDKKGEEKMEVDQQSVSRNPWTLNPIPMSQLASQSQFPTLGQSGSPADSMMTEPAEFREWMVGKEERERQFKLDLATKYANVECARCREKGHIVRFCPVPPFTKPNKAEKSLGPTPRQEKLSGSESSLESLIRNSTWAKEDEEAALNREKEYVARLQHMQAMSVQLRQQIQLLASENEENLQKSKKTKLLEGLEDVSKADSTAMEVRDIPLPDGNPDTAIKHEVQETDFAEPAGSAQQEN